MTQNIRWDCPTERDRVKQPNNVEELIVAMAARAKQLAERNNNPDSIRQALLQEYSGIFLPDLYQE